jgi:hypothetical protein
VSKSFGPGNRLRVAWSEAEARSTSNRDAITGSIRAEETISHWSLWTEIDGGTCRWTGNWNKARAYLPGDSCRVDPGTLTLTYPA